MSRGGSIEVVVVMAWPGCARTRRLRLPVGTTAQQAVRVSAVLDGWPAARRDALGLAVFGRAVALDALLDDGDRVEVLRPLTVDPKEARRRRARKRAQRT